MKTKQEVLSCRKCGMVYVISPLECPTVLKYTQVATRFCTYCGHFDSLFPANLQISERQIKKALTGITYD